MYQTTNSAKSTKRQKYTKQLIILSLLYKQMSLNLNLCQFSQIMTQHKKHIILDPRLFLHINRSIRQLCLRTACQSILALLQKLFSFIRPSTIQFPFLLQHASNIHHLNNPIHMNNSRIKQSSTFEKLTKACFQFLSLLT